MAEQGRWFKLWTTAPDDPDLGNLSLEDFARWCLLGVYLKVHGSDGRVVLTPPAAALVRTLRLPDFTAALDFVRGLPNCTVTLVTNSPVTCTIQWSNWAKYQGDYSGDRVRRFRENKQHLVTPKKRREQEENKKRGEQEQEEKKSSGRVVLADDQFIATLRANPAYQGIDLDREFGRMDAWLLTPKGRGRKKTRQFVVNWLNRVDRPLELGGTTPPSRRRINDAWKTQHPASLPASPAAPK
mgnify:FL=1